MKIAIHQPNFLSWVPYFHKIHSCDRFVFLEHCQYEKNNFQNRFQLDGKWFTCRVDKSSGSKASIFDKRYVDFVTDWTKIKSSLPPKYATVMDIIDGGSPEETFSGWNNKLGSINAWLNAYIYHTWIAPRDVNQTTDLSVDWKTNNTQTHRLIEITHRLGGTEYVSGPSGMKYMDMSLWSDSNISVSQVTACNDKRPILEYISELI